MELVLKLGQIILSLVVSLYLDKNRERAHLSFPMAVYILESIKKMKLMEKVNTNGQMDESIMVNGKTIKCQVKVFSFGLMGEFIKVIIHKTRKMGLESTLGRISVNTKASGKLENNMDLVFLLQRMEKLNKDSGVMASG